MHKIFKLHTYKYDINLFQEVHFLYNGLAPVTENLQTQIWPFFNIGLHIIEFLCYYSLNQYIQNHHQTLLHQSIINQDTYSRRRRVHLFTFGAQLCCFCVEMIYLVFHLSFKIIGRKYFHANSINVANVLQNTEFGVISTFQVLSMPDLRNILFAIFGKH